MTLPAAAVELAPVLEMAAISLAAGIGGIVAFALGVRLYSEASKRRDSDRRLDR